MSEFYFDYRCISLSKDSDKNNKKALDFFLFQNYENGSMNVQVYVPKELQKKNNYDRVRVYESEYGVDFYDIIKKGEATKEIPMRGSQDSIEKENSFTLLSAKNNLSGVGIIAFMRQDSKELEEEDCYKYAINFSRREIIPYRILEKNNKIIVEVRYPRLLKDINLLILRTPNAKPLLISDRYNSKNIVTDPETNKPVTINLKKMGKDFTWTTLKLNLGAGITNKNDYRLIFEDEEDGLFYMLDDESDFTIEDQKEREKVIARENKVFTRTKKVIKCPYCGQLIPKNVIKASKGLYKCNGELVNDYTGIKGIGNGRKAVICCKNLKEISNKIIQCDTLILPDKSEKLPTMNIAVAGYTRCGKTVYLASMINMFMTDEKKYDSNPFILKTIVEKFSKKKANKSVEMVKMLGYNKENGGIDYSQEDRRSTTHNTINIKGRYTINVGQEMESHTDATHAVPLSWNPIGFRLGDLGFTYFYDVPGEAFMAKTKEPLRTFNVADGIIAIIDGEKLSASRSAGKKADNESLNPINNLKDTLEAIQQLAGNSVDLSNVPIAIVFTKLDLKIWQYVDSDDQSVKNKCFDDNCHILREDMISLFPKNRRYHGSELERHINCSSYELEHFLRNLNEEEKGKYEAIVKKYHNIKFFACSSVGSDSVFERTASGSGIKRRPRRLRIELPLIWLMHKNGLVRN